MWKWSRIEKTAWTDRKTKCENARDAGRETIVRTIILKKKKNWIGSLMRGECLLREVMEGRMEGKKSRGRKRMGILEELHKKESNGITNRKVEYQILWK